MEFCKSVCLTACFLATGGLRFYCFKMHVWSTTGSALVCLIFYSKLHVPLKCMQFLPVRSIFYLYIRTNHKNIHIFFE